MDVAGYLFSPAPSAPLYWGLARRVRPCGALRSAGRASHRAFPARWRTVYYSCRDVYVIGLIVAYLAGVRQYLFYIFRKKSLPLERSETPEG
ncbi:MAG: hypothetical protein SVT56_00940 [Chloroflexota bacterium]|nr:hypothetical protein [Chloroflexota bacterium]